MPDVIAKRQVVYFWLPAIGETSTVREIGNLALYALMIAQKAYKEGGGKRPAYLVCDEVQQMASEGFKLVFRQARSFGLSLIIANQSEADLITRHSRLLDTIRANTQVKLYLSISDPLTIKTLEKASGLIPYYDADGNPRFIPRMTINDIRFYSSHEDYGICWITRDAGFAAYGGDWFGIKTRFHIPAVEFERRDHAPWTAATPGMIVAQRDAENPTSALQNRGAGETGTFGSELEEAGPLVVPADSKWAMRLMETYDRRFVKGGNGHEV